MHTRRNFLQRSAALSAAAFTTSAISAISTFGIKPGFAATAKATVKDGRMTLPDPDKTGGIPLMQALNKRRTIRRVQEQELTDQDLSNLLWAVWGVNRDDGRRTAPTAMNHQNVTVLAAMRNGVWMYEGKTHELVKKLDTDYTKAFGGAPLTLAYAAEEGHYGGMHAGALFQNAGLYCASAGLANVVKASGVDILQDKNVFPLLGLPSGYRIMIVQSIGHPA